LVLGGRNGGEGLHGLRNRRLAMLQPHLLS
jgi:hypothetical protein